MSKLVWNDGEVKLDTNDEYGIYEFKNFTGYVLCEEDTCFVENANFTYHFKKKPIVVHHVFDYSHITNFQGVVHDGVLRCKDFNNSVLKNGIVNLIYTLR